MCIASLRAKSASPPRTCTSTPSLFAGGCAYAEMSAPSTASKRAVPATTMFSPSLADSSTRWSSSSDSAPGPRASTASRTSFAYARNSSFPETGSVSHAIATIVPFEPSSASRYPTLPSVVSRPARLAALAIPFSRRRTIAASMSPFVSCSACLQAMIPAPVRSRSSFTRLAEISAINGLDLLGRGRLLGLVLRRRRFRLGAVRGRLEVAHADLLLALLDRVGDDARDQRARADGVVVARDDVVRLVGVAVRVNERNDGHVETAGLADGERLLLQVDDEDRVRLLPHVGDAAEVLLELLELAGHCDALLRREQLELALVPQTAHLVEPLDSVGDRPPVREQAAEPAMVDVRHADALGLALDGVLRLFLRADEQNGAAALGEIA